MLAPCVGNRTDVVVVIAIISDVEVHQAVVHKVRRRRFGRGQCIIKAVCGEQCYDKRLAHSYLPQAGFAHVDQYACAVDSSACTHGPREAV